MVRLILRLFMLAALPAVVFAQAPISISPAALTFGSQAVGTTSGFQEITVTNTGGTTLEVNGVTIAPAIPTAIAVSYATDFGVSYTSCTNVKLSPGASCLLRLAFSPGNANGVLPFPASRSAVMRVYGWNLAHAAPSNSAQFLLGSVTLSGDAVSALAPDSTTGYSVVNISLQVPGYPLTPHAFNSLNNAGQAAGNIYLEQPASCEYGGHYIRAMIYDSGTVRILGTLPNARSEAPSCLPQSEAIAINNAGQILGMSEDADGNRRPVIFSGANVYTLDSLVTDGSGTTFAYPITMSPNGIIAAYRSDLGFVLLTNGKVTDLKLPLIDTGAIPLSLNTEGFANEHLYRFRFGGVNDSAQALVNLEAGPCNVYAGCAGFHSRAAYLQGDILSSFPAVQTAYFGSLTNSEKAIGMATFDSGRPARAALWEKGVITDLSGLPCAQPSSMNLKGQVVVVRLHPDPNGNCDIYQRTIAVWTAEEGMADLTVPGWTFVQHGSYPQINDGGQILTEAYIANPEAFAVVLLTPVVSIQPGDNTVKSGQTELTFTSVTSNGTVTVAPIDPVTIAAVPTGFAVLNSMAYEISTTATYSGPVDISFLVPDPITAADFNDLAVLHMEAGTLLDITTGRDFSRRTLYGRTSSLSPFYVVKKGVRAAVLLNTSHAYKAGSTVPVKVQILNASNTNISASSVALTVRGLRRIGANSLDEIVQDAGNANPDGGFRYDSNFGGYIYNLTTKGLQAGKYVLSFFAGSDRSVFYTAAFEIR